MLRMWLLVCALALLASCSAGNCVSGGAGKNTCASDREAKPKDICNMRTFYFKNLFMVMAKDFQKAKEKCKEECATAALDYHEPLYLNRNPNEDLRCNSEFVCLLYTFRLIPSEGLTKHLLAQNNKVKKAITYGSLSSDSARYKNICSHIAQALGDLPGLLENTGLLTEKAELGALRGIWETVVPVVVERICNNYLAMPVDMGQLNIDDRPGSSNKNSGKPREQDQHNRKGKEKVGEPSGTQKPNRKHVKVFDPNNGNSIVKNGLTVNEPDLTYICDCYTNYTITRMSWKQLNFDYCSDQNMRLRYTFGQWQAAGYGDVLFQKGLKDLEEWVESTTIDNVVRKYTDDMKKPKVEGVLNKPQLCTQIAQGVNGCPYRSRFAYSAGSVEDFHGVHIPAGRPATGKGKGKQKVGRNRDGDHAPLLEDFSGIL